MFDIKKQLAWSELKVGLIIFSALVTIVIVILFAGSMEKLFSPRVEVAAHFRDIKGLREGNPVWLAGIEIGSVKRISLHPAYGTEIILSIKKDTVPLLKKDSKASILTQGLLGDKFVELSPGSPSSPPLKENDAIQGKVVTELQDIVEASSASLNSLSGFIGRLEELLNKIDRGEGTLARFVNDPSLFNNLNDSTKEFAKSIRELKKAKGTLGKLIHDESIYKDIKESMKSIKDFTRTLQEGKGTIRYLIDDPSLYEKLLNTSTSLERFLTLLTTSNGTVNMLVNDPSLYKNMNEASIKIKTILQYIEEGKGIAGDFVMDRELKDDLRSTLTELKELIQDIKTNPGRYFRFSLF